MIENNPVYGGRGERESVWLEKKGFYKRLKRKVKSDSFHELSSWRQHVCKLFK